MFGTPGSAPLALVGPPVRDSWNPPGPVNVTEPEPSQFAVMLDTVLSKPTPAAVGWLRGQATIITLTTSATASPRKSVKPT